jgi:hypothetical protein
MREAADWTEADDDRLSRQALRYVLGELPGRECAAFEDRLGDDQAAREAVCRAVQLTAMTWGLPVLPGRSYREQVRRRLSGVPPQEALPPLPARTPYVFVLGCLGLMALAFLGFVQGAPPSRPPAAAPGLLIPGADHSQAAPRHGPRSRRRWFQALPAAEPANLGTT